MKAIELLAPAKDLDAGIAAIQCGADAVYIGATRFGARENAGNSVADIARLAQYAHIYWARVYVTLNTLLYDREIPEAVALIYRLYEAGVDGLIIQDLGLLECALPPLPLIASTQMHTPTPAKAAFLEHVGFQRVILPRELNLAEIEAIRDATALELEVFVHGALCVSYSGQCYLSYALGGRSGNRGQCAQPCRRAYTIKDARGNALAAQRYWLSLKDLNRSAYLKDLIEAGVTSFKIEGRLKDTVYVKNIVSYYRQQLDAVLEEIGCRKSSSGRSRINFTPEPVKTFNRGFTPYFLNGQNQRMASFETPKALGEKIGAVVGVDAKSFTLQGFTPLHNGDGICFFDQQRELRGTVVNSVKGDRVFPRDLQDLAPETVIYRNYDHEFTKKVQHSRIERSINVALYFAETPTGFALTAEDEEGNQARATLDCQKDPARNQEAAYASLKKQFATTGATEFRCADVTIELATPYFLPVAQINALRRNVLAALTQERARQRPIVRRVTSSQVAVYPAQCLDFTGNVLNKLAAAFYRRHGVLTIEPAAESGLTLHDRKVMTTKYCLKRELGWCKRALPAAPEIAEPIYLEDEDGQQYRLRFDCQRCEMEIFFGI